MDLRCFAEDIEQAMLERGRTRVRISEAPDSLMCGKVLVEYRDGTTGRVMQVSCGAAGATFVNSGGEIQLSVKSIQGPPRLFRMTDAQIFSKFRAEGKITIVTKHGRNSAQVMMQGVDQAALTSFLHAAAKAASGKLCLAPSAPKDKATLMDEDKENRLVLKEHAKRQRESSNDSRGSIQFMKRISTRPTDTDGLCTEQQHALSLIAEGHSVFITGPAGTGKSFLLNKVLAMLPRETTFVTAATGIAASNIGGTSVHAFAGIGTGSQTPEELCRKVLAGQAARRWRQTAVLVIDEISMIDDELFDKLEYIARTVRNSESPFGGIQVIATGDFYQLPPVVEGAARQSIRYAFESESWRRTFKRTVVLKQVFRQKDPEFYSFLNEIRRGLVSENVRRQLALLNSNKLNTDDGIMPTVLVTHRADVDSTNIRQLEQLPGEAVSFEAKDSGVDSFVGQLRRSCLARDTLRLKVGAQVMLLKNLSAADGLVNGARGVVTGFSKQSNHPIVRFVNGVERMMMPERWSMLIAGAVVAERKQIPLDLAWAISIHKCQGLTLDRVQLSLSKVFENGMAYVALSRARTARDVELVDYDVNRITADPKVAAFYARLQQLPHH